jgi:hypothetical protein
MSSVAKTSALGMKCEVGGVRISMSIGMSISIGRRELMGNVI